MLQMVGLDENLVSDLQASQVFICLHAALNLSRETELSRRVPREGEHYASALRSVAGWPQGGIAQVCQRLELIKMRTARGDVEDLMFLVQVSPLSEHMNSLGLTL